MKNAHREATIQLAAEGRLRAPARSSSAPYAAGTGSGMARRDELWKRDAQWTAIAAYVADMYLPNEG